MQFLRESIVECCQVDSAAGYGELAQCHPVLRERSGLIDAQDRRCSQRLNRRHPPCQYVAARDPPGPQRQKHRQHDRELFGQRGHGHGNAGEQALLPNINASSACDRKDNYHKRTCHESHNREGANQSSCLFLQKGRFRLDALQRLADLSELRTSSRRYNFGNALSGGDQGS
jgi:hypothetical protein